MRALGLDLTGRRFAYSGSSLHLDPDALLGGLLQPILVTGHVNVDKTGLRIGTISPPEIQVGSTGLRYLSPALFTLVGTAPGKFAPTVLTPQISVSNIEETQPGSFRFSREYALFPSLGITIGDDVFRNPFGSPRIGVTWSGMTEVLATTGAIGDLAADGPLSGVTMVGLGSVHLQSIASTGSDFSFEVSEPFVSQAPDGMSLYGVDGTGQLVLALPRGLDAEGVRFSDLFVGWTVTEFLADPFGFYEDSDVRAALDIAAPRPGCRR